MAEGRTSPGEPRLSVAIPYLRGLGYLREAIDSVLAQDLDEWELVVVDDHGPEPADALAGSYDDPRIRFVRNEQNLGLAGNWNECLRLARGPLVTILHADDRLLPSYARTVVSAAAEHPGAAAIFTDAVIIDDRGARTTTLADRAKSLLPRPSSDYLLSGDAGLAGLLRGNYIVCPSLCFRRASIRPAPFRTDLRFVPDWELTTGLLLGGQSLYGVREPLIEYRRHGGAQTSLQTSDATRFVEELDLMRTRAAECARLGFPRASRTARRRVTVRGHLLVRALIDAATGRRTQAGDELRMLRSDLRGDRRVGTQHPDP